MYRVKQKQSACQMLNPLNLRDSCQWHRRQSRHCYRPATGQIAGLHGNYCPVEIRTAKESECLFRSGKRRFRRPFLPASGPFERDRHGLGGEGKGVIATFIGNAPNDIGPALPARSMRFVGKEPREFRPARSGRRPDVTPAVSGSSVRLSVIDQRKACSIVSQSMWPSMMCIS